MYFTHYSERYLDNKKARTFLQFLIITEESIQHRYFRLMIVLHVTAILPTFPTIGSKDKSFKVKYYALTHHDKNLRGRGERQKNEAVDKTFKVTISQ